MITTVLNLFKSFEETFVSSKFQDIYDDFIDLILLPLILKDQLICPFCREEGRSGHFTLWSVYSRLIRTGTKSNDRNGTETETDTDSEKTERIRIRRIRCTCCRHTHAILPELIVPYSSLPAGLHLKLVQAVLEDKDKAAKISGRNTAATDLKSAYAVSSWRNGRNASIRPAPHWTVPSA